MALMRRYWLVGLWKNGFEGKMLVYGTKQELWAYLNSEIKDWYSYSGATTQEIEAARLLKIKTYIAPELNGR